MSAHLLTPVPSHPGTSTVSFSRRIAERRRLARHDRQSAQLAQLHSTRAVLADARTVVAASWIQGGWFAYRDGQGRERLVGPHNLHEIAGQQLTGACLVGAIVHAGGGLPAARTAPVHHALDLAWQALFQVSTTPLGHCPGPALRTARVRDLTKWNDRPSRTTENVTDLLGAADRTVGAQIDRVLGVLDRDQPGGFARP